MNEGVLQDDVLDQGETWLPSSTAETGDQGGGTEEEQEGPCENGMELFYSRSTESSSSGSESNRMESSGTGSRGLESDGSLGRNSSMRDKPSGSDGSHSRKQSSEEVMAVIREMKRHLPAERPEICGRASTLCALQYALKCVRQIQADSQTSQAFGAQGAWQADAASYSIEELAAITSEHAPKNTDTFVAVFSLLSGEIVHLSDQAASVLNCKRKILDSCCFAQLLAPQDLGTFYTYTNQSHLPLWNMETQAASLYAYSQVRPFFCRLRGGGDRGPEKRCYPFWITPYLVNVCVSEETEPESCCLALAEKIHSGYKAPRIPLEKRIFTTTHTPGCVFLEIDDRAVPLLGYLPQELAGTSLLMYLHPEDRPLMVAVHRKVLRFAGQPPFEHSPIRFCTQNGDYVVLDTSWSSFVNPWSRKVAFVIGRHKVRTSPLNEDVFAARSRETHSANKEIWELQEEIYKILLQPVHSNGSSGYGSLISSGSYEHYVSVASSSDSNGNYMGEVPKEPVTPQQVFADVNRLKNVGQQLYIESHSQQLDRGPRARGAELLPRDHQLAASRLACAATASNNSSGEPPVASGGDVRNGRHHLLSYQQINCMDSVIRYLEGCSVPALKRKCDSSANASSSSADDDERAQHSRDEAPVSEDAPRLYPMTTSQPKGEAKVEAAPRVAMLGAPVTELAMAAKALSAGSVTSRCSYSSTLVHFPHPESEATALEDSALLAGEAVEPPAASAPSTAPAPEEVGEEKEKEIRLVGLTTEVLSAHTQKEEQNYVDQFHQRVLLPPYKSYLQHGGGARSPQTPSQDHDFPSKQTSPESWRRTGKQGKFKRQRPQASLESSPCGGGGAATTAQQASTAPSAPALPYPVPGFPVAPLLPPCLPCSLQPLPTLPVACAGGIVAVLLHSFPAPPLSPEALCPIPSAPCPPHSCPGTAAPASPPTSMAPSPTDPAALGHSSWPEEEPLEGGEEEYPHPPPPPLFSHSRSSSPLQLNLLQEELPRPLEPPGQATVGGRSAGPRLEEEEEEEGGSRADSRSVSSELLDLLLLEGSQSGSGSASSAGSSAAESVSLVSGSNGTSGCGAGSRNSSSGYLASNDSSEVSKRGRGEEEGEEKVQPARVQEEVLQADREKLAALEKQQPRFTEEQKEELAAVHPWIRTQTIPQEINTQGCVACQGGSARGTEAAMPEDGDLPDTASQDGLLLCETLSLLPPPPAPPPRTQP